MGRLNKIIVVMIVAPVLLYYGVAWAVLRCSHNGDDSNYKIALLSGDPVHLNLECVGPNFHTEVMAAALSLPRRDHLMPDVSHVSDFLTLQSRLGDAATDFWLTAVFETSPSFAFLISLPSYLFLSVLRI